MLVAVFLEKPSIDDFSLMSGINVHCKMEGRLPDLVFGDAERRRMQLTGKVVTEGDSKAWVHLLSNILEFDRMC
jgi:hypothetical protein